jgi:hypothetical protein
MLTLLELAPLAVEEIQALTAEKMAPDTSPIHLNHINTNSLNIRRLELLNLLHEYSDNLPMLCLNDTRLNSGTSGELFNDYVLVRKDHRSNTARPRGVAIALPNG